MDAFLLSFLLCLLLESAGKPPELFDALMSRYRRAVAVSAGLLAALALNAAISALAGNYVAGLLTPEARSLFFALALAFAAFALFMPMGKVDKLQGWRLGPFLTSALGLFILSFGESAQFIIAGLSAAYADPWMAGSGGLLGGVAACLLMPMLKTSAPSIETGIKSARIVGGVILLISALATAASALRLA